MLHTYCTRTTNILHKKLHTCYIHIAHVLQTFYIKNYIHATIHATNILHTYYTHFTYKLHTYCIRTTYIFIQITYMLHTSCIHPTYIFTKLHAYCIHTTYNLQTNYTLTIYTHTSYTCICHHYP